MKCPVCKHREFKEMDLHSEGFHEGIMECGVCGTSWSVNHGVTEIIKDRNKNSFLDVTSDCVESDDYILAV